MTDPRAATAEGASTSSDEFESASELSEQFGAPVFEPTWWPSNVGQIGYSLDRLPRGIGYRMWAFRHNGSLVSITVRPTVGAPGEDLPSEGWRRSEKLAPWDGFILGEAQQFRAVVYRDEQTIHLTGYESLAHAEHAAASLRRTTDAR